ncbi:hypothetical protein ACV35N_34535, partial [Pseudomonas aeruginosa]
AAELLSTICLPWCAAWSAWLAASAAIQALASEIGRAVGVVQNLAKDSENINAILVAIRGIAEQTNLL